MVSRNPRPGIVLTQKEKLAEVEEEATVEWEPKGMERVMGLCVYNQLYL